MTRHKLDLFSLISGLFLVLIAVAALFGVNVGVAAWVWPTVLIVLGVVVIASVATSSRQATEPAPAAAEPKDFRSILKALLGKKITIVNPESYEAAPVGFRIKAFIILHKH